MQTNLHHAVLGPGPRKSIIFFLRCQCSFLWLRLLAPWTVNPIAVFILDMLLCFGHTEAVGGNLHHNIRWIFLFLLVSHI